MMVDPYLVIHHYENFHVHTSFQVETCTLMKDRHKREKVIEPQPLGKGSNNATNGNDRGAALNFLLKRSHDVESSIEAEPMQSHP